MRGKRKDKGEDILSTSNVCDRHRNAKRVGSSKDGLNDMIFHPSDDEEDTKDTRAPEEKKILEGHDVIKQLEKYYTLGMDEIFSILVTSIFSAPARLCYKMLNYNHVKEIVDSMIQNLGHDPTIVD